MGLTSRREKIVLFGDSLTQRAIEQGGWGESLVRRVYIIRFLFLLVYYYASNMMSFFFLFFILEFDRAP